MAKNMKIRRGNDGFSYPYTSPDLVVDENGKSATTKFNELEAKIGTGSGTSIDDVNTSTDKTWSSSKIDSQFKDIAKKTITTEERTKLSNLENYDDSSIKSDIQVQKARIDSFTSLKEGSTTGDAELIDARVGADEVTYDNLGDSIRQQIKSGVAVASKLVTPPVRSKFVKSFNINSTGNGDNKVITDTFDVGKSYLIVSESNKVTQFGLMNKSWAWEKTIASRDFNGLLKYAVLIPTENTGSINAIYANNIAEPFTDKEYVYEIKSETEANDLLDKITNKTEYDVDSIKELTENSNFLKLPCEKVYEDTMTLQNTDSYITINYGIYHANKKLLVMTTSEYINQIGMINQSYKWEEVNPVDRINNIFYTVLDTTNISMSIAVVPKNIQAGEKQTANIIIFDITSLTSKLYKNDVLNLYNFRNSKYNVLDILNLSNSMISSRYSDKNVLVIGDSITADGRWQLKLNELLNMNVTTHAKGGMGIVQCVDGEDGTGDFDNTTGAIGTLYALNSKDVADKSIIIFLAGYNNRGTEDGQIGDCYNKTDQTGKTIAGFTQYAINRIYEELSKANNLRCKVIFVTPHCAGKYSYCDVDGYGELPPNSGFTLKSLAQTVEDVANHNNIPCYNAWKNSGINKFTWNVFSASSSPNSNATSQGSGGQYYWNNDQLHLNNEGYARLGECIVNFILTT